MAINSRAKGASAEREVAALVFEELGIRLQRNLEQYRADEQGDLNGLDGWTIEVKHYAKAIDFKREWWVQAVIASERAGNQPALVWRGNRQAWRVTVRLSSLNPDVAYDLGEEPVTLSFRAWASLVRENLKSSRRITQTSQSSIGQSDAVNISITTTGQAG
jgi:hypothetical protein